MQTILATAGVAAIYVIIGAGFILSNSDRRHVGVPQTILDFLGWPVALLFALGVSFGRYVDKGLEVIEK